MVMQIKISKCCRRHDKLHICMDSSSSHRICKSLCDFKDWKLPVDHQGVLWFQNEVTKETVLYFPLLCWSSWRSYSWFNFILQNVKTFLMLLSLWVDLAKHLRNPDKKTLPDWEEIHWQWVPGQQISVQTPLKLPWEN